MELQKIVSLGCDPEIFVSLGKKQASCHELLPGTKKEPFKVPGGAVQVDGTAAEFNIEAATKSDDFVRNIDQVVTRMRSMMREKHPDATFTWIPTRKYTKRLWADLPESAKEMGCDPDFNAYTGEENPRPHCDEPTLRSAGGHVHIGWCTGADIQDKRHLLDCRLVVSAMDAFLFPFSKKWDDDERRRLLYGKPGAYRPKSYGVEYRTLSNMWVKAENTQRFVYAAVKTIMEMIRKPDFDPYTAYRFTELWDRACDKDNNAYEEIVSGKFLESCKETSQIGHCLFKYAEEYGIV